MTPKQANAAVAPSALTALLVAAPRRIVDARMHAADGNGVRVLTFSAPMLVEVIRTWIQVLVAELAA